MLANICWSDKMQYVGNNIRKENDFMSFVSMHLVDDGIIAISDS